MCTGDRKLTRTQWIIIGVGISIAVLLGAVTLVLIFTLGKSNKNDSQILGDADEPLDYTPKLPAGLRMVDRDEWKAIPPKDKGVPLQQPVPLVIIHHTATAQCWKRARCLVHLKAIQKFHMDSNGWRDVGYNFLLGGDGYTYVGTGWNTMGTHTLMHNNVSIGIAFIGTFGTKTPPSYQLEQATELIKFGKENGHLTSDYKVKGMKDVRPVFKSPGDKLMEIIKTWDRYSPGAYYTSPKTRKRS